MEENTAKSTLELSEKWRIKGNEAYADKNLPQAEDYYTRGINSILSTDDTSQLCNTAMALCYSNRAAVRMSMERMREALEDCLMAAKLKPDFLKAKLRAANCHLALGEIEAALRYFNSCVPQEADLCLDRQLVIEASNGLQKAQKARDYLDQCDAVLQRNTSSCAESVLGIVAEALVISPFSEKLLERKAAALLMASAMKAFTLGKYSDAVEHYTSALTLHQKWKLFTAICFSGRAAAFQALGKIRAALEDCKRATDINPHLHETHVRAGNCHLALGQISDAVQYFKLPQGADLYWDRELRIEASDGLLKALEADNLLGRCDELLLQRTSTAAERALKVINRALSISPYSEKVIERKANALLMLLNYEEMFQLIGQSLDAADDNYYSASIDGETRINVPARVWRLALLAKGFFYSGRLEETLAMFETVEEEYGLQKFRSESPEAAWTLAATVRELLGHKSAGDEALRSGRHLEAVEHYTSALSCNLESRPFSALCLFNRAAANEALGPITNAIADCSLAIALAGNYPKALFKRATLHEMIRDYTSATTDLQRLISEQKDNQSEEFTGLSDDDIDFTRLTDDVIDMGEAQSRLTMVKEMAKKPGIKLDMYLILGLKPSCVASDISAAYRKAALRHHPDKAPLSLSRNGNGDNAVWKEIAPMVNKDAELLFKTIGEAYTELSNSEMRSKYDAAMAKM